jgi:hypothetical protein
MPDIEFVETADHSPSVCCFCGTNTGPFVEVKATLVNVSVAEIDGLSDYPDGQARIQVRGRFYLCVGKGPDEATGDYDDGCARRIGAQAGCLTPGERQGLVNHVGAHRDKIVTLEQELQEAKAKPQVVNVEDLLDMIAEQQNPKQQAAPGATQA